MDEAEEIGRGTLKYQNVGDGHGRKGNTGQEKKKEKRNNG